MDMHESVQKGGGFGDEWEHGRREGCRKDDLGRGEYSRSGPAFKLIGALPISMVGGGWVCSGKGAEMRRGGFEERELRGGMKSAVREDGWGGGGGMNSALRGDGWG